MYRVISVLIMGSFLVGCPKIVYVDKDSSAFLRTGLSWSTAVRSIEDGIATAEQLRQQGNSVQVWVAEGSYEESTPLQLKLGIPIYGGFKGDEAKLSERDWVAHPVYIEGHRAGTMTPVVAGDESCVMDGFYVRNGDVGFSNTNGTSYISNCTFDNHHFRAITEYAGNLVLYTCTLIRNDCIGLIADGEATVTASNCIFTQNGDEMGYQHGCGMTTGNTEIGATFKASACEFTSNFSGMGSGIYIRGKGTLDVEGCLFGQNTSTMGGTAIAVWATPAAIKNSTFRNNESSSGSALGGALYLHTDDSNDVVSVQGCDFEFNRLNVRWSEGGAIYGCCKYLTVSDCSFVNNSVNGWGGAISNWVQPISVQRCVFVRNSSILDGGAICGDNVSVENSVFSANDAEGNGGAVYSGSSCGAYQVRSDLAIKNCTFVANTNIGGVVGSKHQGSTPEHLIANSILWDRAGGDEILDIATVTYCDVFGGYSGVGNINIDPLFVDEPDDLHLRVSPFSPCIDSGTAQYAPADSLDNVLRPQGNGVDMGAYEQ